VVGPVELTHRVSPVGDGSTVAIDIQAPGPVEAALRATYGPLVQLLVRRLSRMAER